jgi:hypothetical protein
VKTKTLQIILCFMVFLVCSAMIVGCKNMDTKTSTGITLKTTKDVFIATAKTAKDLCEAGVISEADCFAMQDAYADGQEILIKAHAMWGHMVSIDSFVSTQEYEAALVEVARMAAIIHGIIREYD